MIRRIATIGALAALAAPAAALADGGTTTAQQQCRSERTAMGAQTFKDTYGTNHNKSNAFGKCVAHRAKQDATAQEQARTNAAKQCKAEQASDAAAFTMKYGTGKNGRNAYGKCVSTVAKAKAEKTETTEVKAEKSAAKQCKAERKDDADAFRAKYGTNHNKSNAFGKCVSTQAKNKEKSSTES